MSRPESAALLRGFLLAHKAPPQIMQAITELELSSAANPKSILELPVAVLLASTPDSGRKTRALNTLINVGASTVGDVTKFTAGELLKQPNFGRCTLRLIEDGLAAYGLSFKSYSQTNQ